LKDSVKSPATRRASGYNPVLDVVCRILFAVLSSMPTVTGGAGLWLFCGGSWNPRAITGFPVSRDNMWGSISAPSLRRSRWRRMTLIWGWWLERLIISATSVVIDGPSELVLRTPSSQCFPLNITPTVSWMPVSGLLHEASPRTLISLLISLSLVVLMCTRPWGRLGGPSCSWRSLPRISSKSLRALSWCRSRP